MLQGNQLIRIYIYKYLCLIKKQQYIKTCFLYFSDLTNFSVYSRVLRLLEQIRDYSDYLYERLERTSAGRGPLLEDDMDRHPCPAMAALMKLSFDEDHRHAMCSLGGLHAIAELIRRDHDGHGSTTSDQYCITLRRWVQNFFYIYDDHGS